MVADLPAGGRRLMQKARGYVATVKAGQIIYRNGEATGALPGGMSGVCPPTMKPYKIVIIVVVAVIALAGAGVMVGIRFFNKLTGPIFGAGTAFVTRIGTQGPDAAYDSASPVFQAQTSRQAFANLSARLHLAEIDRMGWSSMSMNGSNGTIGGTATLKSGTEVPMEMTLVYQNGNWLVTGLAVPGGLQTGGGSNQPKN